MFFNKPKAKYNIVNDLDSDVFNLFQVVMNQKEELEKAFYIMPIHSDLVNYWNKNEEIDFIRKALRFLLLSNFVLFGRGGTLRSNPDNSKRVLMENMKKTFDLIFDVQFFNKDFRKFINSISLTEEKKDDVFFYCDSPYLGTEDNYSDSFTEKDSNDLFDCLEETKCRFAYSEFNHPFILEQAKQRNLNVITIGERQNLKNKRVEILVTNYENHPTLF